MDRGVWPASVHGVIKNQTQLSDSHTHTHTQEVTLEALLIYLLHCIPLHKRERGIFLRLHYQDNFLVLSNTEVRILISFFSCQKPQYWPRQKPGPLWNAFLSRLEILFLLILLFSIVKYIFKEKFQSHSKIEQQIQRFPMYSLLPHIYSLPYYQNLSPSATFVTINEPILAHHYQQKSIVPTRVRSWCCAFYEFGMYNILQMQKDMYLPLWCQKEQFKHTKNLFALHVTFILYKSLNFIFHFCCIVCIRVNHI